MSSSALTAAFQRLEPSAHDSGTLAGSAAPHSPASITRHRVARHGRAAAAVERLINKTSKELKLRLAQREQLQQFGFYDEGKMRESCHYSPRLASTSADACRTHDIAALREGTDMWRGNLRGRDSAKILNEELDLQAAQERRGKEDMG